ncbi:hypothetical protein LTR66_002640 [Elasticomyces elasticus]|nr:hypothetical protein LTR66_002640 [Elasticomyces elasticus]
MNTMKDDTGRLSFDVVEASISQLQQALQSGNLTSVDLVAHYLLRINAYDCRGPCLNSIPILNPSVFSEAAASDARRAAGKARGPLDGIPYTLKDSIMYEGMTCAAGSPAFVDLEANSDAFIAEKLRESGAVLIGRTNMPPMACGGMQRGVYGRAESPYNLEYLTAAFSSGSSNGSATSTAASFAAFGIGSETVSSGRSPASNNGLVAYTPSRGVMSCRGVWPLYPTCDVIVPHTRTLEDMLAVLDVVTAKDSTETGDFWREQRFVKIPDIPRPESYTDLASDSHGALAGKRIGAPRMYIGGHDPKAKSVTVSQEVIDLWKAAKTDLEALGATIVETDFPLVTNYEDDSVSGQLNNVKGAPDNLNALERSDITAYAWDDFLKFNGDPNFASFGDVDFRTIFPKPKDYIPDHYFEHKNAVPFETIVKVARNRSGKSIFDIPGMAQALHALEAQRKRDLEDWMDDNNLDLVVFPANGDVGKANLEYDEESSRHALSLGVKYSNGNRAIRHMGVPTVSVTMGVMRQKRMPVNLTFAGKAGQDTDLLRYAHAFEQQKQRRVSPPLTPRLASHAGIGLETRALPGSPGKEGAPALVIEKASAAANVVTIQGHTEQLGATNEKPEITVFIDGKAINPGSVAVGQDGTWKASAQVLPYETLKPLYGGVGTVVENVIAIVLARSSEGVAGDLALVSRV